MENQTGFNALDRSQQPAKKPKNKNKAHNFKTHTIKQAAAIKNKIPITNIKKTESTTTDSENKTLSNEGNTLSVSFSRVKGRDSIKIANFFLSHPDEPFTPKQLSFLNRIGHSSAKMICQRFLKKGYIEQPLINHYQYKRKITAEELEILQKWQNLKLHNIMLIVGHTSGHTTGVRGISDTNKKTNKSKYQVGETAFTIKLPHYKNLDLAPDSVFINVKILHYPQKFIIYIQCTENPLDFYNYQRVIGHIEGKGYNLTRAEIGRIEINNDIPDLQIDGAQRIELQTFSKAWQRIYNKNGNLREEVIIRGAKIPIEEGIAALRGKQALGTNTLISEVEQLKTNLKENNRNIGILSQTIKQIYAKIDRI